MIENVLDVKEIILHKNEPLALKLVAIQPETQEGFENAKKSATSSRADSHRHKPL